MIVLIIKLDLSHEYDNIKPLTIIATIIMNNNNDNNNNSSSNSCNISQNNSNSCNKNNNINYESYRNAVNETVRIDNRGQHDLNIFQGTNRQLSSFTLAERVDSRDEYCAENLDLNLTSLSGDKDSTKIKSIITGNVRKYHLPSMTSTSTYRKTTMINIPIKVGCQDFHSVAKSSRRVPTVIDRSRPTVPIKSRIKIQSPILDSTHGLESMVQNPDRTIKGYVNHRRLGKRHEDNSDNDTIFNEKTAVRAVDDSVLLKSTKWNYFPTSNSSSQPLPDSNACTYMPQSGSDRGSSYSYSQSHSQSHSSEENDEKGWRKKRKFINSSLSSSSPFIPSPSLSLDSQSSTDGISCPSPPPLFTSSPSFSQPNLPSSILKRYSDGNMLYNSASHGSQGSEGSVEKSIVENKWRGKRKLGRAIVNPILSTLSSSPSSSSSTK